jgi:hypothetical protein
LSEAIVDQKILKRYLALERWLHDQFSEALDEAEALSNAVIDPRNADANAIWSCAWDKPLFANTKVMIGTKMVQLLAPFMEGAWKSWGTREGGVYISKIGKGIGTASFEAGNQETINIRATTRIAMHRLYAIQGAAIALRNRHERSSAPYADLFAAEPESVIRTVQSEMGPGWGPITALHFLTDLGLACKPDIHLVRAARHLGLLSDLPMRKVPNLADAVVINRRVRNLVEGIYGEFEPRKLRYVDKILMEISRKNVIAADTGATDT